MTAYYYVKANRQEWTYPKENGRPTDFENFPLNEEQDFATFTKNQLYWKNLKKGDIIIGHSSYISSNIKDKLGRQKVKFTPRPRISAIIIVTAQEHHSKVLETDAVTLKKIIELNPLEISKELIDQNKLRNFKPFALGTNRCTITKLEEQEFNKLINLIAEENNSIKDELKKYL